MICAVDEQGLHLRKRFLYAAEVNSGLAECLGRVGHEADAEVPGDKGECGLERGDLLRRGWRIPGIGGPQALEGIR